jgi:MFS family permease
MLLTGGALMSLFSLANAFCQTYEFFVIARALTGVGSGIVMPNAVATLTVMVPPGKARNVALATFAASPPLGAIFGGLFTGALLGNTEWKWLFIFM